MKILVNRSIRAGLFAAAFCGATMASAVGSGSTSSSASPNVADQIRTAYASINAGQYASAIQELRGVIQVDMRNADAHNLLGFASRNLGDYDNAKIYYANALTINKNHKGALEYQGELFLLVKQPELAQNNLARLLQICGANCEEYLDLKGDIAAYQGSS